MSDREWGGNGAGLESAPKPSASSEAMSDERETTAEEEDEDYEEDESAEQKSGGEVKFLLRFMVLDPWSAPPREQAAVKLAGGICLLAVFAWLFGPEIVLRTQGKTTSALITRAWEDYETVEANERERQALICLASYRFEAPDGTTVTGTRKCPAELYRLAGTRHRQYWVVPNLDIDANGEYVLTPHEPVTAKMRYLPAKPSRNHFVSEEQRTTSQIVFGGAFLLLWLNAGVGCVATGVLALIK